MSFRKNYVDNIYKKVLAKRQSEVFNRNTWVSIDETTDVDGCSVANVIVNIHDSEKLRKVMVVNCEHLEKTNRSKA